MEREIRDIGDLAGRRVVFRQEQAGSQALLEHLLTRSGVPIDRLQAVLAGG